MPTLKTREEAGVLVITLDDLPNFNDGSSEAFRETLYRAIESRPEARVALDLSGVDYLSSSGIAMLIGVKRRLDARSGKLVLFALRPYIRDLLDVMKLTKYFAVVADAPAAVAALATPPSA